MKTYNSERFSYNKNSKEFTAFASDLDREFLGRIYPDACDVGIAINSAKTGKIAVYYLECEQSDRDNDIQFWTLIPTVETIKKLPGTKGTKVRIFND